MRWLRIEGDALPVLDRATLLDRIGAATDARDKCLRLLRLDVQPDFDSDAEHWKRVDALQQQKKLASKQLDENAQEARQHAASVQDDPEVVSTAPGMPAGLPEAHTHAVEGNKTDA